MLTAAASSASPFWLLAAVWPAALAAADGGGGLANLGGEPARMDSSVGEEASVTDAREHGEPRVGVDFGVTLREDASPPSTLSSSISAGSASMLAIAT